jgi:hypothetical protein
MVTLQASIVDYRNKTVLYKRVLTAGGATPMDCILEATQNFKRLVKSNHRAAWEPEIQITNVRANKECPALIVLHIPK